MGLIHVLLIFQLTALDRSNLVEWRSPVNNNLLLLLPDQSFAARPPLIYELELSFDANYFSRVNNSWLYSVGKTKYPIMSVIRSIELLIVEKC